MYKKIISIVMMFSAMLAFTSCMDNDTSYTYYDDSAITSFSLGNVQYVAGQKKLTGEDSIVSKDFSAYKFQIDQLNSRIYNVDSLPVGALATKVLCTLSTRNSGMVGLKGIDNDTVRFFSTSDTIDFSKPRTLIVYSNSGLGYRRYTVEVNVHKQDSAAFVWTAMPQLPEAMKTLADTRLFTAGEALCLIGTSGSDARLYKTDAASASAWSNTYTWSGRAASELSAVSNGTTLYVSSGTAQLTAVTATANATVTASAAVTRLVAATPSRLYAYIEGRGLVSAPLGAAAIEWTDEPADEADLAQMPQLGTAFATLPLTTNSDSRQIVAFGHNAGDAYTSVWSKIEETREGSDNQQWMVYPYEDYNYMRLKPYDRLQAGAYNGQLLALGSSDGAAPEAIYRSIDKGLTWQKDTVAALPATIASNGTVAFTTGSDNFIWLVCGGSGQVWRGRQNFLGWAVRNDFFEDNTDR